MISQSRYRLGRTFPFLCAAIVAATTTAQAGPPAASEVSYQGQLKRDGAPANGVFDFQFTLRQADGVTLVDRTCAFGVDVVNGLFQAELQFADSSFDGSPRLLQLGVRNASAPVDCSPNTIPFLFELLTPLQPISAAPYALHAFSAPTGSSLNAADGSPVNALVVDNIGRVGIGTVTPAANLHVLAGSAAGLFANAFSNLVVEDSATNYISFLTPDTSESGILFANEVNNQNGAIMFNTPGNADGLQFRTGGNFPRMTLSGTGDIGIGTAAPTNRLSVNGSADFLGNVGIGTASPAHRLHVSNGSSAGTPQSTAELLVEDNAACYVNIMAPDASKRGVSFGSPADATHGGIYYTNAGGLNLRTNGNVARMTITANGDVGIGVAGTPNGRLHVQADGRVAKFDRFGSDGEIVVFAREDGVIGNITNVGGTVSYNAFTGSHYAWSAARIAAGALVSMTGENRRLGDRGDAEAVYGIQETSRANDPACLGVHLGPMESTKELSPENPKLVAAVGNGELCVVDRGGGDIEPGDYLISSDVPGCAMKDDPAKFPIGHVIAKSADRVRWSEVSADQTGLRRVRGSVLFTGFARTIPGSSPSEHDSRIARLEQELEKLRAILPQAAARQERDRP